MTLLPDFRRLGSVEEAQVVFAGRAIYRINCTRVAFACGLLILLDKCKIVESWGLSYINHLFAQLHLLALPHRVVSASAPSQALTCSFCPSCSTAAKH